MLSVLNAGEIEKEGCLCSCFCFVFSVQITVVGEKKGQKRGRGERRSSTAGLKTYVTVGSQRVNWERKLGQQRHFSPLFSGFCRRYEVLCVIRGLVAFVRGLHVQTEGHFLSTILVHLYFLSNR